uniref:DNA-directed RNA polymerase III subunit RPC3 n=1 Tax=Timema douglasi TaxID=61478 RepID=A0A7R8VKE1_TIMDO|nr:unnamed protein product [Timema douglasi]
MIRAKKFAEQEQIQQVAMIPAKECKLLTYKLLEESFLQMQELRKSLAANVPNKTFFLFHIELDQSVILFMAAAYQTAQASWSSCSLMWRRSYSFNAGLQ